MKSLYEILAADENWQVNNSSNRDKIKEYMRPFMFDNGSLTKQLMDLSDEQFEVRVIDEKIIMPHPHEQKILKNKFNQKTLIRQVELKIFGQAVVFARSIIPNSMIIEKKNGLSNLGKKPLGHLLFRDGKMDISKREFKHLIIDNKEFFARRTPYQYQGKTILVSEFFLPTFKSFL